VNDARFALIVCVASALAAGCASTGAVPRPFPGAPVASQPTPEQLTAVAVRPPPEATAPLATISAPPPDGEAAAASATTLGALALASALQFQGVPYRSGGSNPAGFDCSGLVQYVFARQGIAMPREVRHQFQAGYEIAPIDVRPGDLLFFNTERSGASHVGIAIDALSFVHAPNSRGVVRIERVSAPYWSRRFLGARRIE
jgi:cell wall-associated NlpC family hydrolase